MIPRFSSRRVALALVAVVLPLTAAACGDDGAESPAPITGDITSITSPS